MSSVIITNTQTGNKFTYTVKNNIVKIYTVPKQYYNIGKPSKNSTEGFFISDTRYDAPEYLPSCLDNEKKLVFSIDVFSNGSSYSVIEKYINKDKKNTLTYSIKEGE